ncbi:MAG TPA: TetR/AcrR family transcriptional regulator [Myxococcota bacterium]|nr:TetR/AcrR family transcriptional regulator [Myxococcota bacterium]
MPIEQDKQERILAAAAERFARFGFKKTSIDEIARDAGVGKGTVYLVAESKEDLFFQVVHRELRAWVAEGATLVDPRRPADELLVEGTMISIGWLQDRPLVRDLLLGNHEEVLPLWTDRLDDLRAICRVHTETMLRLGVRQGRFRRDLDVEGVAVVLQDLLIAGLALDYRLRRPIDEQARSSRLCLDLLLRGLLARP